MPLPACRQTGCQHDCNSRSFAGWFAQVEPLAFHDKPWLRRCKVHHTGLPHTADTLHLYLQIFSFWTTGGTGDWGRHTGVYSQSHSARETFLVERASLTLTLTTTSHGSWRRWSKKYCMRVFSSLSSFVRLFFHSFFLFLSFFTPYTMYHVPCLLACPLSRRSFNPLRRDRDAARPRPQCDEPCSSSSPLPHCSARARLRGRARRTRRRLSV